MRIQENAQCLRVYIGESDQWRGRPLYLAILEELKNEGLAGATVTRGLAGFGAHSRIHTTAIEVLSSDLPLVIEVIDDAEAIRHAVDLIGPMVREGLVTTAEVRVAKYSHRYLQPLPGDRLIREVMTRTVVSVTPATPLAELVALLIDHQVKAAPVVDQSHRVIGIISDGDILERGDARTQLRLMEHLDEAAVTAHLQALRASPKTAADIMTRDVVTAREEADLARTVPIMIRQKLKRLPVVDRTGRLTGMLSRLDVLHTVARLQPEKSPPLPVHPGGRTVGEVMDPRVPTVLATANLADMVEAMAVADIKRIAVVDGQNRIVGVISDGDLVSRVQPENRNAILAALIGHGQTPSSDLTARDIMSKTILQGPPETSVPEAIRQMLAQGRKRYFVVGADGHLLGAADRPALLAAVAGLSTSTSPDDNDLLGQPL